MSRDEVGEGSADGIEAVDLRLVGPAVAVWVGTFAGTSSGVVATAGAIVSALAACVLLALGQRACRAGSADARGPSRWVAGVLVCVAGGLAVGGLHLRSVQEGPVGTLAVTRATVTASATVMADPRRARSSAAAYERETPLVLVRVRLDVVVSRGRQVDVRSPVLVFASDVTWLRLLPGQRVELSGRLGPARPGQPVSAVLSAGGPPAYVEPPSTLQQVAGVLRAGLRTACASLGRNERGLLPGLVVGDTSRMPADLTEDFRTAGMTHLTAVSGANLAIVTGFVLLVGRRVGLRGRWLPFAAAVAMVGFVVLARPQPSVVRAAAMGAVALVALASGRRRRSLAALGATVVLLLLVDPWLSRSYGFVLSVLATGGLVLLAPGWARHWQERGFSGVLAQALAVPLAAQLVCAPVVAMISDQVSLVAVPANLLAGPAVAPATILGVLATVTSAIHEPSAAVLARLAAGFVWWVVQVAEHAARAPLAAVAWPGSLPGALLLALVSVALVVVARRAARRRGAAAGGALLLTVALAVPASGPGWPPAGWLIAACDVGQGDALVLAAGGGSAVVVDVGPDPVLVERCLRRLKVRHVALILLTHLHADHVEGLPGVLRSRDVGEIQVGIHDEPVEGMARVQRWAEAAGVPVTRARLGDRVRVGALTWEVLGPTRLIRAGSLPNNSSTVLGVELRGVRMLLTGDAEPEAQRALLAAGGLGPVDVLKVAHHGSAYQEPELLPVVRPRVALISSGAGNDYGHPAPETLAALRRAGAVVGRTDRHGTVVVAGTADELRLVVQRR